MVPAPMVPPIIWSAIVLLVLHLLFRAVSCRAQRMPSHSDDETLVPLSHFTTRGRLGGKKTVCVTGGAGFLGSAIVRRLVASSYNVVVLDIRRPREPIAGVDYVEVNLATADLASHFALADGGIVHTAGLVFLRDDPDLLYNAHVVVTRNVLRCARRAGVRSLCFTSSGGAVTSPYLTRSQLRVPCDLELDADTFPFASHYSREKYRAERIVLAANEPGFATLALRLPGLYGLGDRLIVDPLLRGTLSHVPSVASEPDGCTIDFCYVENAAHAHCVALDALATRPATVGGRAFNITNGEMETRPVICMWNALLALCRPGAPRLRPLPFWLAYALACATELIDWFTCGRVPFAAHPIWELTRASLGFATTPISLALSNDLGYVPMFTTAESFADIKRRWQLAGGGVESSSGRKQKAA